MGKYNRAQRRKKFYRSPSSDGRRKSGSRLTRKKSRQIAFVREEPWPNSVSKTGVTENPTIEHHVFSSPIQIKQFHAFQISHICKLHEISLQPSTESISPYPTKTDFYGVLQSWALDGRRILDHLLWL